MSSATSDAPNRDSWNKHKWRRDTSWWDDLEVDSDELKALAATGDTVFDWLEKKAPDPAEHDYILYTDGSGCEKGWGGYAAVIERIEFDGEFRCVAGSDVVVAATYGSTVQRSEFNALLDGVQKILSVRCHELKRQAIGDEEALYKLGTEGLVNQFTGPDRLTILWYTDRDNLAKSFLYNEDGDPLAARNKERDLWLRWSFFAKHVCITPMCRPRNVIAAQAVCDELAGAARELLKGAEERLAEAAAKFHPTEQWLKKKSQVAQF